MLQQILADMYIDPDILEALNEEQKKTLFLKMREEQVRRWKEREEKEGKEARKEKPKPKKGSCKSVSWLLGRDGEVHVCIIGETDELKSPKAILSELRERNEINKINRPQTTVPLKNSLTDRSAQQTSTKPGIELLLKKAEQMNRSSPVQDIQKQDSDSDSLDDLKDQKDDSDSSDSSSSPTNHNSDVSVSKSHRTDQNASITERLNQLNLQRNNKEQLSIRNKPRPQDPPAQEKEKGVVNEQPVSSPYGGRVAQLRRNFNTSGAKTSSPCVKPPIPTKPAHLLTSASAR